PGYSPRYRPLTRWRYQHDRFPGKWDFPSLGPRDSRSLRRRSCSDPLRIHLDPVRSFHFHHLTFSLFAGPGCDQTRWGAAFAPGPLTRDRIQHPTNAKGPEPVTTSTAPLGDCRSVFCHAILNRVRARVVFHARPGDLVFSRGPVAVIASTTRASPFAGRSRTQRGSLGRQNRRTRWR